MSNVAFKRFFTNPVLRRLRKEKNLRKTISDTKGQILILRDIAAFHRIILTTFGIDMTNEQAQAALEAARSRALGLQNNFARSNKRRFNRALKRIPSIPPIKNLIVGKEVFILTNFKGSISLVKDAIWESLLKTGVINEGQQKKIGSLVHKGHGAEGLAVSEVEISSSIGLAIQKTDKKFLLDNLSSFFIKGEVSESSQNKLKELFTTYEQQITKTGKLRADYFALITFQIGEANLKDSPEEKALKKVFREYVRSINSTELLESEGSSTLKEKIEADLLKKITPKSTKSMKVKLSPKRKKVAMKTKGQAKVIFPTNKITAKFIRARDPKTGRFVSVKTNSSVSLFSLVSLINAKLPDVVAKNMGLPALVYRTGRFAESVKVIDVQKTPKGFPSFGFTYMKNPYQIFEIGLGTPPWATPDRDPRKIIDKSIREIATEFAVGRFFTRRV